jgi:hypothetical protein
LTDDENRSLVGMKIKAPMDIYTANFTGFNGTLIEAGYKDNSIALSGTVSDVTVENARTNDAFSTNLFSYISDSKQTGFALPNIGINVSTLYGAFPKHYSDFLTNQKHREELYDSLLGDAEVKFTNFVFATYARVKSKYWRGESIDIGFYGPKISIKSFEIGGIGKGEQILHVPAKQQQYGFGKINFISSDQLLNNRRQEYNRMVSVGNSSGIAHVYGQVDPVSGWVKYQQAIRLNIAEKFHSLWGE